MAKRRKPKDTFWDDCDQPPPKVQKAKRPPDTVLRVFVMDGWRARSYETRPHPEAPDVLYYDWRSGSKNRGPQTTKPT